MEWVLGCNHHPFFDNMKTFQRIVIISTLLSAGFLSAFAQTASTLSSTEAHVTANLTSPSDLSYGTSEIVKLYQSGVGTDLILGYVKNYRVKFQLSGPEIIYLHNLGVSSEVVLAMLQHDRQIEQENSAVMAQNQTFQAPAQAPQQATVVVAPTPPQVVYVAPYAAPIYSYPAYSYYPNYYSGYYGPSISLGFGHRFGYGVGFRLGGWR